MIVDSTQLDMLMAAVNIDKHQSEDKTILIFVNNSDVDSICAVRQLQVCLTPRMMRPMSAASFSLSLHHVPRPMPTAFAGHSPIKRVPLLPDPRRRVRGDQGGMHADSELAGKGGASKGTMKEALDPTYLGFTLCRSTNLAALVLPVAQELRTVFLINCGATEDVRARCDLQDSENVRVVIVDSHRPVWHGYKNGETDTLVIVDKDDPVPERDIPVFEAGDEDLKAGERLPAKVRLV